MVQSTRLRQPRARGLPPARLRCYRTLDIGGTLGFFEARYVKPLAARFDLGECTLLDCACGYGWLAIAFVLSGGSRAIAIDLDAPRLHAARNIAAILGVGDRVDFAIGSVKELPIADRGVDISISVETLEHLGGGAEGRRAVAELGPDRAPSSRTDDTKQALPCRLPRYASAATPLAATEAKASAVEAHGAREVGRRQ